MESLWDVIVVGAGLAGVLTAYYLKEQGMKVLVLEAKEIASGQTERTTAKITSQHGLKYRKLIKDIGEEKARMYALANESAIREYERLIRTLNIDQRNPRCSHMGCALVWNPEEKSWNKHKNSPGFRYKVQGIKGLFLCQSGLHDPYLGLFSSVSSTM